MVRLASRILVVTLLTVAGFALASDWCRADSQDPSRKLSNQKTNTSAKQSGRVKLDRETEAKANALVDTHLTELKELLRRLKSDQPSEYKSAMRDLARSARKLEIAKNRDQRLYDLEVELLQARTQTDLLTAKLRVRDSEKYRRQLRAAIARLQQADLDRTTYEVQSIRERLERQQRLLDTALKRLEAKQNNPDASRLKSYHAMLRKAGRQPEQVAEQPKPAREKSNPPTD